MSVLMHDTTETFLSNLPHHCYETSIKDLSPRRLAWFTQFFMIWYHLIFADSKKTVRYAWNLMGFVAKLAHEVRSSRSWRPNQMIPEEHAKQRHVFWELLNLDCRMVSLRKFITILIANHHYQSLSLGRPSSIEGITCVNAPPYERVTMVWVIFHWGGHQNSCWDPVSVVDSVKSGRSATSLLA